MARFGRSFATVRPRYGFAFPAGGTTFTATLTTSGVGLVSLVKQAQAIRSTSGVGVASRSAQVQAIRSATGIGTVVLIKLPARTLTASGVGLVSLAATKVKVLTLTATGIGTASVSRQVSKTISAAGTGTASIGQKAITTTKAVTGVGVVVLVKQARHSFLTASGIGLATSTPLKITGGPQPGFVELFSWNIGTVEMPDYPIALATAELFIAKVG